MAARSTGSASISFGLVSIPVDIFTATAPQRVSFNMLHKGCGSRVRQRMVCPVENVEVQSTDIIRGYEYERDKYVAFTDDELRELALENRNSIELEEFVPESSVDKLFIASSNYLGPGKNGARPYHLLAKALARTKCVAIGRFNARGKAHVVAIRSFKTGLILHQLYFEDEVRSFDDAVHAATFDLAAAELEAAKRLIDTMSSPSFDPSRYEDTHRARVKRAVEEKTAGLPAAPEASSAPTTQIIDLLEALKRSVAVAANESHADEAAAEPPPPSARPGPRKAAARNSGRAKKKGAG